MAQEEIVGETPTAHELNDPNGPEARNGVNFSSEFFARCAFFTAAKITQSDKVDKARNL